VRILLTGAAGQVGTAVTARAQRDGHEVVALAHSDASGMPSLDVTDAAAVDAAVAEHKPDWVLNAAAMTSVDACEKDRKRAARVNGGGAENLARAAAAAACGILHISTDYVFDGATGMYAEGDPTGPVNAYGRSKLLGEHRVLMAHPAPIVARTCVVFGPTHPNFVTWAFGELRAGRRINVIRDQWISPTYAPNLAKLLLALMTDGAQGVWHAAGAQRLSRLEMVQHLAEEAGLDTNLVTPIEMQDMTWSARRPRDTSLDVTKISRVARPLGYDEAITRLTEAMAA
jgi:dTDP-4-dehydrorhamnose reductase